MRLSENYYSNSEINENFNFIFHELSEAIALFRVSLVFPAKAFLFTRVSVNIFLTKTQMKKERKYLLCGTFPPLSQLCHFTRILDKPRAARCFN